jgi:gamma-glutamyl:cysteine ligase YbdK (ATP-grasp superfamily)
MYTLELPKKNGKVKVGIELEGHLIDLNGTVANRIDDVVGHQNNDGSIIPELAKSMFELVTPPYSDLDVTYSDLKTRLKMLQSITNDLGLRVIPTSSIHNESLIETRDDVRPRGKRKRVILGDENRDLEHHLTGTHIHVDRLKGSELGYKQFILMQAMDPVFSLMSSSPFFHGENSRKDYRVEIYRNKVFEDFPLQGQLWNYPESLSEAFERQRDAYRQIKTILGDKGLDTKGITELNCVWGPLRLTDFGTIESRASDSNELNNVVALAALYKGVTEYLLAENPEIIIDVNDEYKSGELFRATFGRIVIPSYKRLKEFERLGIQKGLEDSDLTSYLANMLVTGSRGLDDPHYLSPFVQMIHDRKTFADDIVKESQRRGIEINHRIDGDGARQLRNYIADRYEASLN